MAEPPQHDRSEVDDTKRETTDSSQNLVAHDESEELFEESTFSSEHQPDPIHIGNTGISEVSLSSTHETDGEALESPLAETDQNVGHNDISDEAAFSEYVQPSADDRTNLATDPTEPGMLSDENGFSIEHQNTAGSCEIEDTKERKYHSDNDSHPDSDVSRSSPSYEYETNQSHQSHIEETEEDENQDGEDEIGMVSFKNKRVLLIEDEKETAEIISKHLKHMGFSEVTVTSNATGALNQLAKDKDLFPDIVLLELALIGMDGIQFLAQLRAHKSQKLQNLPAVVITMLDSPSIYRRAAHQKVGAFLRKPVSTESLRKGMNDALSGQIVEKPFSQPKSWLDDIDEEELRAKRDSVKAKASAKAQKLGFWGRLLDALIPWSGKA